MGLVCQTLSVASEQFGLHTFALGCQQNSQDSADGLPVPSFRFFGGDYLLFHVVNLLFNGFVGTSGSNTK